MPDPAAAPQAPGGSPAAAKPQAPFGASPATQPTANKGYEMAGLQRLGLVVKGLEQLIPLLGSSSEAGRDVVSCLQKLVKHVPAGSVTPAAEKNQIEQMAMRNAQNSQQAGAMRQQAGAAGGGGAPAPQPAAA